MVGLTIDRDVPVPMRDGVVLRGDVNRPAGEGPWPVIVARTPYGDNYEHLYPVLTAIQAACSRSVGLCPTTSTPA
jgi:predicted acyl esterase